jgi:hypothetical protein
MSDRDKAEYEEALAKKGKDTPCIYVNKLPKSSLPHNQPPPKQAFERG